MIKTVSIYFFIILCYNIYRKKKKRGYFMKAITFLILLGGIIYYGTEFIFEIFFNGKK